METRELKEGMSKTPSTLTKYLEDIEETLTVELNDIVVEMTEGTFNATEIHDRVTEINAQIRLIKKIRAFMRENRRYQR